MRKNILVYNDCSNIAEKLIPFCAGEGISVRKIVIGKEMELFTYLSEAHLLLLDIFMDGKNWLAGIKLINRIRAESKIPIIIVSDQKAETVKIMTLDAGADDFVSTEMNPLEIMARIKSQIRRYTQMTGVNGNIDRIYRVDGLEVDDIHRRVTVNNREVHLTSTEYKILRFLINEKGKVYSNDEIYEAVWRMKPIGVDNTIAVHIRHIREKIEENPKNPYYLKAAWGKGYLVG
ncbi:MAG: response regulator transcription factor [Lachnospiraceae bacterium]|nr:response regulator transcription factor [Lachnospiraceae bacterium]